MTTTALATALTACAAGLCPLEAGTALPIAEGTFLRRDDFTGRFIEHGTTGQIPCSSGGRRILLLAASIAGGLPASLGDTLRGIDNRYAGLVINAIAQDELTDLGQ